MNYPHPHPQSTTQNNKTSSNVSTEFPYEHSTAGLQQSKTTPRQSLNLILKPYRVHLLQ